MSRFGSAAAYERWVREEMAAGRQVDALRPAPIADEVERFWSRVLEGAEHDYWQGAWYFKLNNGSTQHARRYRFEMSLGRTLNRTHEVVETRCNEHRCIRLSHLRLRQHRMTAMTEGEAIAQIRSVVRTLGRVPGRNEYGVGMPSPRALERVFGSVASAIEAAGFEPRKLNGGVQLYSDADIQQAVRTAVDELGHMPTGVWWERTKRAPSLRTIERRFGSLSAAVRS